MYACESLHQIDQSISFSLSLPLIHKAASLIDECLCHVSTQQFYRNVQQLSRLAGVSISFDVGGWKMKVGGSDEARGQRHAPPPSPLGKFLKFGVSMMHFLAFWLRNYDS